MSKEKQFPELSIESFIPFEITSEAKDGSSSFKPRSSEELEEEVIQNSDIEEDEESGDPIEDQIPDEIKNKQNKRVEEAEEEETDEEETSDDSEEEGEEEEDESDDSEDENEFSFEPFAKLLHDNGLFDYDEENFDDSVDSLIEGYNKAVEKSVKKVIDQYPKQVQELVDFINNGGNITEYLYSASQKEIVENYDIEEEKGQKTIISAYLKSQEYSDDEIADAIQDYEDSGILEKEAKRAKIKYEKIVEKKKQSLIEEQRKEHARMIEAAENKKKEIESFINKSDSIAGIGISKKEKEDFYKWLTVPDKNGETGYVKAINENPTENAIMLAFMKYKNFDFSKAKKEGKKEASLELRKKIFNGNKKKPKARVPSVVETSDLSAFESFRRK